MMFIWLCSALFLWKKFPLPWKIDPKLGLHLIKKFCSASLSQCVFIIQTDIWLYFKSVDRIFSLAVHVWITKTYDGSFNWHVDIVNFSSFGFFLQLETSYCWITTVMPTWEGFNQSTYYCPQKSVTELNAVVISIKFPPTISPVNKTLRLWE